MRAVDVCQHLQSMRAIEPLTEEGCQECLQTGDRWVQLRLCMSCGHVGCCDSSPNRHATAHHRSTGHEVVQSFQLADDWAYCYTDESFVAHVAPEARRPAV